MQNLAKEEKKLEQEDGEQDWTKHTIAKELINIGSTTKVPIACLFKYQPRYYVNMLEIPTITKHASVIKSKNMVEPSLDETKDFNFIESLTQARST